MEGKLDHRDAERARRLRKKGVGDHTSRLVSENVNVSAQTRMAAALAAITDVCGKATEDDGNRCAICGRQGEFIEFTDFGQALRRKSGGYRLRLQKGR